MANTLVSDARVEEEVRKALGKALRKEPSAIPMEASVTGDLGGTSLDFLDVIFRLEQAFGIRLAHQGVLDHVEEQFGEGKAIDASGALTAPAVTLLRMRLGDHPSLRAGMYADEVPTLVTPRSYAAWVREILDRLPAACTHCRASAWKSPDGARVVCGACGKDAVYPDGDSLTKQWLADLEREKGLFAA
jgi:acyl carrier protein